MADIVPLLTWILDFILETHLPLLSGFLLVLSFGGLGYALAYRHSTKRKGSKAEQEANRNALKAGILSVVGFVFLIILYGAPFLLAGSKNPYSAVLLATVLEINHSAENMWGNNLIWWVATCIPAVDLLRRATSKRKKGPRSAKNWLWRIFVILVILGFVLPILVAVWNAAKSAFPA